MEENDCLEISVNKFCDEVTLRVCIDGEVTEDYSYCEEGCEINVTSYTVVDEATANKIIEFIKNSTLDDEEILGEVYNMLDKFRFEKIYESRYCMNSDTYKYSCYADPEDLSGEYSYTAYNLSCGSESGYCEVKVRGNKIVAKGDKSFHSCYTYDYDDYDDYDDEPIKRVVDINEVAESLEELEREYFTSCDGIYDLCRKIDVI